MWRERITSIMQAQRLWPGQGIRTCSVMKIKLNLRLRGWSNLSISAPPPPRLSYTKCSYSFDSFMMLVSQPPVYIDNCNVLGLLFFFCQDTYTVTNVRFIYHRMHFGSGIKESTHHWYINGLGPHILHCCNYLRGILWVLNLSLQS